MADNVYDTQQACLLIHCKCPEITNEKSYNYKMWLSRSTFNARCESFYYLYSRQYLGIKVASVKQGYFFTALCYPWIMFNGLWRVIASFSPLVRNKHLSRFNFLLIFFPPNSFQVLGFLSLVSSQNILLDIFLFVFAETWRKEYINFH